ncbi:MAG TPA: DUF192 domain-containing protein [Candidatus Polarisedimenticolia bacterium]|nr:DUF192 domain-containing protein [Candidatus Polarisedimenticolia bacterium]
MATAAWRTLQVANRSRGFALGALVLLAWSCAGAGPMTRPEETARDARRAEVHFPTGRVVVAEIADTPARWEEGYMFRREVGENDGMIFVFPEAGVHPFWMKNTLVPLDMIWMDDAFTVIHVEAKVPPCTANPCPTYGPLRLARYVLEVRGGTVGQGLKIGDRLRIAFPQSAQ